VGFGTAGAYPAANTQRFGVGLSLIMTGGTGGIGLATARLFLDEGASVALLDLDPRVVEVAADLGDRSVGLVVDVADAAQVESAVSFVVARWGGLHVMFANAGWEGRVAALTAQTEADVDRVFAVNVKGVWNCIRFAAREMAARGGGSIVCTSSVAGLVGSPGLGPYIASKHAVMGLVKTAALELGPLNIRVNSVNPGPVDNRMMRSIEDQAAPGHAEVVKAGFEQQVPLGRYATNEEIARVVLFLASDDSSIVTGTAVVADGGFVAR
jgi:NAD(P)-dependent dehydrogenase (short-subunit alcohol dehydrogenase family)